MSAPPDNDGTAGPSGQNTSEQPIRRMNIANQITARNRRRLQPVRTSFAQMRAQRKNFIIRVYSLALIFMCMTMIQWIVIFLNDTLHEFFKANYQITYMAVLASLILLTLFILFDELRYVQPYSTMFAFLLVECAMLGLLQVLLRSTWDLTVICTLVAILAMIGFIFIGVSIPRDLTQDSILLSIVGVTLYFVLWITIIIVISIHAMLPVLVITVIIILLLIVYVMYFAQLIDGSRKFAIRWSDYIFASLLVYFNFTVMFALIILAVFFAKHKFQSVSLENG